MGLWLLYLLWWLSVTLNDDKTQKVSEKMPDPERWQATGRIVVSGFHEGGKGGGSEGEPGWREVCGLLWWWELQAGDGAEGVREEHRNGVHV